MRVLTETIPESGAVFVCCSRIYCIRGFGRHWAESADSISRRRRGPIRSRQYSIHITVTVQFGWNAENE